MFVVLYLVIVVYFLLNCASDISLKDVHEDNLLNRESKIIDKGRT